MDGASQGGCSSAWSRAFVRAPIAAFAGLRRTPDRAESLDALARSLGKIFWWKPFKIRFYGLAEGERGATLIQARPDLLNPV